VSDDDDPGPGLLAGLARRRAAPPAKAQPLVTRTAQFRGGFAGASWLSLAWSPDGSRLAAGGLTAKGAGLLETWTRSGHHEGRAARHLTHGIAGPVVSLAWSPDGTRLATVEQNPDSGRPEVRIRGQAEGNPEAWPPATEASWPPATQVAWSPDGTLLALSGAGAGTVLLDAARGGVHRVLDSLSGPVAWSPAGRLIAGTDGASVVLCDPDTGARVGSLAGQRQPPGAIAWARHGRYLAVADGTDIRVWDTQSGDHQWTLPWAVDEGDRGPDGSVTSLEWLDNGHYLLDFRRRGAARRDEQGTTVSLVTLWDTATGGYRFWDTFWETDRYGRHLPIAALARTPDGRGMTHAVDGHAPFIWQINADLPHYLG
jgi:WD40 repeat protein